MISRQLDLARCDLPHVSYRGIDARVATPAVRRPLRLAYNRRDLRLYHGKRQQSATLDLDSRQRHFLRTQDKEVAALLHT